MTRVRFLLVLASLSILVVPSQARSQTADEGRDLFQESCASCHGSDGEGTDRGPSLEDAGAAAADFQLRTGRMPLADPDAQAVRKPPAFSPEEIEAIVAYVGSLGDGPEIPPADERLGDVAEGQRLFVDNCAACHGATANGGAAGVNAIAPGLYEASDLDIAEATITGPGEMPVFEFDEAERNSIARYIAFLQTRRDRGGADIGGIGPVPEGFIAWAVGMVPLVLICMAIGTRNKKKAT